MFGQMMVEPVVQLDSGVDLQTAIATLIRVVLQSSDAERGLHGRPRMLRLLNRKGRR